VQKYEIFLTPPNIWGIILLVGKNEGGRSGE